MQHPSLGAAWEGFVIKQLLLCELGREGASKADADHSFGVDLRGPIQEIEGRAAVLAGRVTGGIGDGGQRLSAEVLLQNQTAFRRDRHREGRLLALDAGSQRQR